MAATSDKVKANDESPAPKRVKTDHDGELSRNSIHETLCNFGNVKLVETINSHASSTFLRCRVESTAPTPTVAGGGGDDPSAEQAIVILEKKPFKPADVENILSVDTILQQTLRNDIYGTYECLIKPEHNGVKATVIHPATDKHVDKYRRRPVHLVLETAHDYVDITLPYIEERIQQFSLQWVENILEHKTESDRIVFEDPNPEDGFVLLPDMKWDRQSIEDLYLVAICRRRGVRSLRDLRGDQHLPLLRNVRDRAMSAIRQTFGVLGHDLRVFFHYQPSYYHLHVHFKHVRGDAAMVTSERSHFLDTVIGNLELMSDYYERASITYAIKEGDPLYDRFKAAGKFSTEEPSIKSI